MQDDISIVLGVEGLAGFKADMGSAAATTNSATTSMSGGLKDMASSMALAFGAAAVGAVVAFGKASVDAFMEYETAVADLSAITGAAGAELKGLESDAKQMGIGIEGGAVAAVEGFKIIKSAMADLKSDEVAKVTKEAIALAQASGMALPDAAKSLSSAMNQMELKAGDAARTVNVLGAAAKFGAAEIPATTDALLEFGGVAAKAKFSIEESAAAIQTLAKFGIEGGEAGTALRNIGLAMTNIKGLPKEAIDGLKRVGVNFDIVSNAALPAAVRLKEFSKVMQDGVAAEKTFGKENIVAAQRLLENIPLFEQLTKQVTGTNTAYEQAAVNNNTLAHSFLEIKNQIGNFMIEIGAAIAPVLRVITEGFTPAWESAKQTLITIYTPMIDIVKNLMSLGDALGLSAGEGNAFVGIVDAIGVALKIVTFPARIIYTEFNLIIKAVTWAVNAFKDARDAVLAFGDQVPAVGVALDVILAPIRAVGYAMDWVSDKIAGALGFDVQEEMSNTTKSMQAMSREAFKVGNAMGGTNEQIMDFAKNLQASQYAGLSMADTAAKLKMDFAAYLESLKATNAETEAGIAPADAFAAAIGGVGAKAIPAAGSIDYLNAKIDALQKSYTAATDGVTRAKLDLQIQKLKFELDAAGGSLDTFKSKIGALEEFSKSVSDVTKLPTRAIESLGDALAIDAPLDAAANKFTLFAATVGDTFKGLKEGIKSNMVQIGADLAFGIGEAIAMGGSVGDVFKAAIREMAVQIPKMAGMALLNAAAFPANAPIALPLAAVGLGLLGLSGILSGLFKGADAKKAQQTQSLAQESGARAPSQGGQLGLSAFVDNSGLASEIGNSVADALNGREFILNADGSRFRVAVEEANKKNLTARGK